ncbi:hypothetical protein OOZ15_09170 [Galbibacter sp. EGI 63066]|uniref:hypothetical protein n=1 Tax=Galbibacter sp. EGI 63066 TaxID=2993559 RepID=UPI0022493856|nr:hypothetical protein [Galbibacter sp. EGI 63066]MCX2680107.1 hypothetical protein [Galbibacter sp. EGI 63066]
MNSNQERIKNLLTNLVNGNDDYAFKPATRQQINTFVQRAEDYGVEDTTIKQLVDLYTVADDFSYEIIMAFHPSDDLVIFEWWETKELWLGQRDFYSLRWANGKFCLGDAANVSFSEDYECDTLIELIEVCIKDIDEANYFGD